MSDAREAMSIALVVTTVIFIAVWLSIESRAQMPVSFAGAWTMNQDLSDQPSPDGDHDARGGGGFGRRRGGGGGFGGGYGRGGSGYGRGDVDREQMARMRDAMRHILNPPEHLTIMQTDSMIAITGADGWTTRLSPDGSKVKDENTNIARKTKWEGLKLVSEISGAGPARIVQTFTLDPERHQLRITAELDGRGGQPRTITHVYEADSR
jgi:hypothetical protein